MRPGESRALLPRVPGILLGDHEVVAARGQLEEPLLGWNLRNVDREVRLPGRQEREGRRHERLRGRLHDRDPHRRALRSQSVELAPCLFVELQSAGGMRGQELAVIGQPHTAPVRREERNPRLLLQLRQLLRHRRRTVGEGLRDCRKRAAERQLVEKTQPA